MSRETSLDEERVLLVTPTGKDAALISRLLERAGCAVFACADIETLCSEIEAGAAVIVIAEEGLPSDGLSILSHCLNNQPAWSDLPVIILTMAGKTTRHSTELANALRGKANLTFLERPLRMLTLVTAVKGACLTRSRQYEIRRLLADAADEVGKRDQFMAMLGHELRNPLAAIRTSVEILRSFGCQDPSLVQGQADVISRQSKHMAQLVDDLLDVARLTSGRVMLNKAPLDLREAVGRSIQGIQLALPSDTHEITADIPSQEIIVSGDPVRLEQVFGNLLSNAVRYSPAGTKIEVSVDQRESEAIVRIRDYGEGIQADLLPRIFEPFVQSTQALSRTRGGLGLGLAVVKNLVLLHGGSVAASSAGTNAGTEFTVHLPLSKQVVGEDEPSPSPEQLLTKPRRILIIEDNADARDSLALFLRLLNHEVFEAGDGETGLERLLTVRPDFALIDIGLPRLSGYDVASRARQSLDLKTVLIALTGYGQIEDRDRALAAGFDDHLVKPLDLRQVTEVLSLTTGRN